MYTYIYLYTYICIYIYIYIYIYICMYAYIYVCTRTLIQAHSLKNKHLPHTHMTHTLAYYLTHTHTSIRAHDIRVHTCVFLYINLYRYDTHCMYSIVRITLMFIVIHVECTYMNLYVHVHKHPRSVPYTDTCTNAYAYIYTYTHAYSDIFMRVECVYICM